MLNTMQYLTLLLVLLPMSLCTFAAPSWQGTNYIQAGFIAIVTNNAHQNASNLYTYTYAPAFTATPFTALGVCGMQTQDLRESIVKFQINIPNYTSMTSMDIRMVDPTTTAWRSFRVSYIAIDTRFDQLRVDYFSQSSLTNVNTGTGLRSYTGIFNLNIPAVNASNTISVVPLLAGLHSQAVGGEHAVYWATKLRTASSVDYNLTVDRTTRVFMIVSYILVVDRTRAEDNLEIFMDELYVGGVSDRIVNPVPVFYNASNVHVGLNSFKFNLISFNFNKNSFTLTTQGSFEFLNISVWSYRQRTCPPATPSYEQNTNLCYDQCPAGYVSASGTVQSYCKPCFQIIPACRFCAVNGSNICTQCYNNYNLTGNACTCPNGFYISSLHSNFSEKCRPCHFSCLTCNGPSSSNCLTCGLFAQISNNTCACLHNSNPTGSCMSPCSDQACQQCSINVTHCQACMPSFTLNGSRCMCGSRQYADLAYGSCKGCHSSCKHCWGPLSTQCTDCDRLADYRFLKQATGQCLCITGYEQVNETCLLSSAVVCNEPGYRVQPATGLCAEICGDGDRIDLQCDDGNLNDGDGCSSDCRIQSGFVCTENPLAPNARSFCSYASQLQLVLQRIVKNPALNQINMTFTLLPSMTYILQHYSQLTNNIVFTPDSLQITTKSAQFNTATQLLEVIGEYSTDIQEQEVTVEFRMPATAQSYAVPLSRSMHAIKPDNKLRAVNHDSQKYVIAEIFGVIGKVCYIGGLVLMIGLAFFRKMVGLEYISMLQLVYFSVVLSDYSHPYLSSVQGWDYINGYNQFDVGIGVARWIDHDLWVLGYTDYFFANCNVMIFLLLANYVLALILFGLYNISDKSTSRKLKSAAIYFAVEIGFSIIAFIFNHVIVSIFAEAYSGHILSFTYGLNKFFLLLAVIAVVAQVGVYASQVHSLNDSQTFYHRSRGLTHFLPLLLVARGLLVALAVVLVAPLGRAASCIALGAQLLYIVAVAAIRPYKRMLDYARAAFIELGLLATLASHLAEAWFITSYAEYSVSLATFLDVAAFFTLVCMLAGLVMTVASFAYHLLKGKFKDASIAHTAEQSLDKKEQNNNNEYNLNESKQKFNMDLMPQKSKQVLIYDMDQEREQGSSFQNYDVLQRAGSTTFDDKPGKKLRSRQARKAYEKALQFQGL